MTQPCLDSAWRSRLALLDFAFQPIVNIHTGQCFGYEALLRNHQAAGFELISDIFDCACRQNILHQIDLHLRQVVIAKFARIPWAKRIKLFYNIDNRLFDSVDYRPGSTSGILARFDFPKDFLCFEISERNELKDVHKTIGTLDFYRSQGFKIAVDDCGTGFSGMQLLYYTEPDFIKIDRFFIQDIENDPKKKMFVASIVDLAHLMGGIVVAEGVETPQEFYSCRSIGCDMVQGNLVQAAMVDIDQLKEQYDAIKWLSASDRRLPEGDDQALIHSHIAYIKPIVNDAELLDLFEKFRQNKQHSFFPVVNTNDEAIGVIREVMLKEFVYSQYGRYLLANPSFGKTIDDFISKFPLADIRTPVEKILQIYSINDKMEGILIVDNMKYVGFLSAHSLLRILNEKNLALARDQNPLSRLPGNTLIYEYVSGVLQDVDTAYVLVYFDFDNFKAYNDRYGFRLGDRLILMFADILKSVARPADHFAGHIGGDDFFMGVRDAGVTAVRKEVVQIVERFNKDVSVFYDRADIQNGYIVSRNRAGQMQRFPLLTVSTVIVELPPEADRLHSIETIGNIIAGLKSEAKESPGKIRVASLDHFDSIECPQQSRCQGPSVAAPLPGPAGPTATRQ